MNAPEANDGRAQRRESYILTLLYSLMDADYNNTIQEKGRQGFHYWKMVRVVGLLLAAGVPGAKISGILD